MSRVAGRQHVAAGPNISSPAALLSEARLQTRRGREMLNAQARESLGSLFTAAQKLKSNEKKKSFQFSHLSPPLQTIVWVASGRAAPFLKHLDKLQVPFRNMRGSQRDPVTRNITAKPSPVMQCVLILCGAAFMEGPQRKLTHPVFNHVGVI